MKGRKRGDVVDRIIRDVNKAVKLFKKSAYSLNADEFEKSLLNIDTSVEKKKKQLIRSLYTTLIKTFSVDINRIGKGKLLETLKNNLKIIREIIRKLNNINYYLLTTFLEEAAGKEKALKQEKIKRLAGTRPINELEKVEETIYRLIEKIIILDTGLLKKLSKKEAEIIKEKRVEISDLETILKKETDLLYHLDAKLPPPDKINIRLLEKPHFDYWVSTALALLTRLQEEYSKESEIFKKLKKNHVLKKKIDIKIKHLMKEKGDALKLKEGRILTSEKILQMDKDWKKHARNWHAVADL